MAGTGAPVLMVGIWFMKDPSGSSGNAAGPSKFDLVSDLCSLAFSKPPQLFEKRPQTGRASRRGAPAKREIGTTTRHRSLIVRKDASNEQAPACPPGTA